jgi:3-phosphoshikimate 1-carboxyvinyltransferase
MTKLHVGGDIRVPGDKSISHRALMLAGAAEGESRLRDLLPGADCRSTAALLREVGVRVPELPAGGGEIRVGSAGISGWQAPARVLDCGNSGTTARLILGLLASRPFASTLTGDDSLRSRPMRRVTDPLHEMGAAIRDLAEPGYLPLEIRGGRLRSISHRSPKASAQIKSAVLLAGLGAGVPVTVWEPSRSRDHTERMLGGLGVRLHQSEYDGGWLLELEPIDGTLPPLDLQVPGDPSSAAFMIALALLAGSGELRLQGVGVNPTRTGLFAILQRMGAILDFESERDAGGEPVADIVVRPAELRGTTVGPEEIPSAIDEIPILAVLASRAAGETRITGAGELRVKESDRITMIVSNLRSLGASAEELPDGLVVRGSDSPLRGRVTTHADHRIAMAFGVLGTLPGNDIQVDDRQCVDVSFPGFWDRLQELTGPASLGSTAH